MSSPQTPPGWYPDQSGQQRWWDGTQWGQVAPSQVPAVVAQPYAAPTSSIEDEKGMATLAQILGIVAGFIGPLIIYVMAKPEQRFVKHHASEALNFSITMFIVYFVCALLFIVFIGIVLLPIAIIMALVFHVIAAMAANRGEWYRYPINIRLVPGAIDA